MARDRLGIQLVIEVMGYGIFQEETFILKWSENWSLGEQHSFYWSEEKNLSRRLKWSKQKDHFTCIVRVLFSLVYTQALVALSVKCSEEDRSAWKHTRALKKNTCDVEKSYEV
ncbi:E3 Ubiquitin-Protein Ligase Ubr3 [Manis pentadactyla]|nr:E3 Ubiquitin-Protein Ligase Ubr3 [Manis pentadactyla]